MLMKQRCLAGGRCDLRTGTPTSVGDKPATEMEELLFQGRETEDHNKFMLDLPSGLGYKIASCKKNTKINKMVVLIKYNSVLQY